jgi:hypothetical protein
VTREDIIEGFNQLLDDHVVWRRGHWDHRAYKVAFFRLFREAYDAGFFRIRGRYAVTGPQLRDEIIERFMTIANPKNVHKLGLLEQMIAEWDAWRFAWDMDPVRKITSTGRWKSTQEMMRSTRPTSEKQASSDS